MSEFNCENRAKAQAVRLVMQIWILRSRNDRGRINTLELKNGNKDKRKKEWTDTSGTKVARGQCEVLFSRRNKPTVKIMPRRLPSAWPASVYVFALLVLFVCCTLMAPVAAVARFVKVSCCLRSVFWPIVPKVLNVYHITHMSHYQEFSASQAYYI